MTRVCRGATGLYLLFGQYRQALLRREIQHIKQLSSFATKHRCSERMYPLHDACMRSYTASYPFTWA
jgi:hypothetical protein